MLDLFTKPPEYTIDTSSLVEIFSPDTPLSKTHLPGLWDRMLEMIKDGRIISHIEVFKEIKPGDDLYDWAQANQGVFKDYDVPDETNVIAKMTAKHKAFVNAKVKSVHADPWLIAQAKCRRVVLVTEETFSNSPEPARERIPNVCADVDFDVKCINLLGLIKERTWSFR